MKFFLPQCFPQTVELIEAFETRISPYNNIPSRKLTYPTLGKGKSSSKMPWDGKYWFPGGYKLNSRDLNIFFYTGVFPRIGVPQNRWFIRENPIRGGTLLLERPIYLVWKPPFCYSNDFHPHRFHEPSYETRATVQSPWIITCSVLHPAVTPRIPWKLRLSTVVNTFCDVSW